MARCLINKNKKAMEKICIKCEIPKPITDFFVDRRLKDGRFGRCKECSKLWVQSKEVKARRLKQSGESIRRSRDKLSDNYVIRQLCHHNDLTPDDIRKYPKLIEATRQVILTNRIIKDEKNKNSKRS